ncbi:unnamed protein product [Spirodela intermedia]|uniref:Tubby C-terminal domain-containing protein n=1 Tax=Spirodela intermedia TaxID=51605 RepID=A0A7I8I958_SPIIN|nr:unnamed protein product [Spirodela intermedia]CAA6654217.1 unnamed protein product [Spirodela intermedia]
MSFRSIIQDVKGEIGSISRKGFEVKLGGYGLRSRSHRAVVHDRAAAAAAGGGTVDALKLSCWAAIPPELLWDVLQRVEDSEGAWPHRKFVVSCAGVCRGWREIIKEIVKTPEISGKLTFPISLKQPGPRDSLLQCFIKRNRATQTYHLYLGLTRALTDSGKFLLAACRSRHLTCTDYVISMNPSDVSKGSAAYIGKLKSNFLGTKFVAYDAMPPTPAQRVPAGNYPLAHIAYELNVLNSRGPRRMQCTMDAIPASAMRVGGAAPTQTEFPMGGVDSFSSIPFFRTKATAGRGEELLVLENKAPRWHEQLQCWCLNFRGRVTVASVKNFQLIVLQFGKVGKDLFTMDYQYPLSAFQAFAICLSSFDTKIACK